MTAADDLLDDLRDSLDYEEYRSLPRIAWGHHAVRTLLARGTLERTELGMDDPRRLTGGRYLYRLIRKDVA